MGRRIGEAGGEDMEDDRDERPGEVQGEAVEGEGEGVVGGVAMVSLGLGRSEFCAREKEDDDELDKAGSGLRVEEDEGLGFGAAGSPISDGSIAEKTHWTTNQLTGREYEGQETSERASSCCKRALSLSNSTPPSHSDINIRGAITFIWSLHQNIAVGEIIFDEVFR